MSEERGMPPTLRVGHLDYKLDWAPETALLKIGAHATCDTNDLEIRIGDNLGGPQLVDAVLHELLHAMRNTHCRELQEPDEEEAEVRWQARALTQVFRDNPELFGWLRDELNEHERNLTE